MKRIGSERDVHQSDAQNMATAYSQDLREKVWQAHQRKMGSQRQIAEYFGVSRSFVEKLLQRRRQSGSLAARRQGGGRTPRITAAVQDHLRQLVQQQPDITLSELADALDRDCHIQVSLATVCLTLKKMGLPRKKSQYTPVNATRPRYVRHVKTTGPL